MTAQKSSKSKRHRGYILTPAGAIKLKNRISELEANTGVKYSPAKIAEKVQLLSSQSLHPTTVRKILRGTSSGDENSLRLIFQALGLELEELDYTQPGIEDLVAVNSYQDWGEAVDVSVFYGRELELETLRQWILEEHCRLVAVLGMGGIGKTTLSVKLAQQFQDRFEFTIWRSLRNAPLLQELLLQVLQFLSRTAQTEANLPQLPNDRISRLLDYLRQQRCLLVLDNVETILKPGSPAGRYREGYEDYGELFRRVAETAHQSCLVLTSREKPQGIAAFEGKLLPVRSWQLSGLADKEAAKLLIAKGLSSSAEQIKQLTQLYKGNPLALKIVATSIQKLFAGHISEFLAQGVTVFNGIRNLIAEQFERLPALEQQILYWLAINREPVGLHQLREDIVPLVSLGRIMEALEYIDWRSLIETKTNATGGQLFTLQPVVMEYVTDRLIEQVCEEICKTKEGQETLNSFNLFKYLALLKAECQDYVRSSQVNLILQPTLEKLLTTFGSQENLILALREILSTLRSCPPSIPGYIAGNVLNLLVHLQTDLSGCDFSGLTIWQADLRGLNLRRVNFTQANLAKSVFSEAFGSIYGIALSPDGTMLATGHADGEVRLWRVADGKLLWRTKLHTSTVWSLAFHPDGNTVASSSFDCTIRLWDASQGKVKQTLLGHQDWVWTVVLSPDGKLLATCSSDRTLKLWDLATGNCIRTFLGHADIVQAVAFSPDGKLFASGSADQTVRLWQIDLENCCQILRGHRNQVTSVAFSPDGLTLASCEAQTIKLWDVQAGYCRQTIQDELTLVWSIGFNSDGKTLVGSDAKAIKFWNVETQGCYQTLSGYTSQVWSIALNSDRSLIAGSDKQILKIWQVEIDKNYSLLQTIQAYTNAVCSVAFSPDGKTLATGGADQTISIWNVPIAVDKLSVTSLQTTLHQHQKPVRALAFSPDGKLLASGSEDKTIWLWDLQTDRSCFQLLGHTGCVWSVAFCPPQSLPHFPVRGGLNKDAGARCESGNSLDSQILASGSADGTIRLWSVRERRSFKTLSEHESWVLSVAFSPDGKFLASSSADQTIRLWDAIAGECLKTLVGHKGFIWSVAFSLDGRVLASAGEDRTIKLWHVDTGECYQTLRGHESLVWSVAFQPTDDNHGSKNQLLASSSADQTIRLWNAMTGQCIQVLEGHRSAIWSVAFAPDGRTLASGSHDETIKLWDVELGKCWETLKPERIYEQMNVTGTVGLTEAQKLTLKVLGAVEY